MEADARDLLETELKKALSPDPDFENFVTDTQSKTLEHAYMKRNRARILLEISNERRPLRFRIDLVLCLLTYENPRCECPLASPPSTLTQFFILKHTKINNVPHCIPQQYHVLLLIVCEETQRSR